ncbi:Serine/threonine-protein kinase StkP [Phycisphaerae bacterium RAS1]|nr:Serine/threonine-protein kinase StkP [Phycisphaerae bacterium RAS1]
MTKPQSDHHAGERIARVRDVVSDLVRRRAGGDAAAESEIRTAHADLMPELGIELAKLAVIEAARSAANRPATSATTIVGSSAFTSVPPDAALIPAESLPGYRLLREIHRGGQGVVYQGIQLSTGRKVAVKVMKEGPFAGPNDRARFEREVKILAHLSHPNIVDVHECGTAAGCFFYVMDYIAGEPLDVSPVAARKRRIPDALRLFGGICNAVEAAHARGIVHRDLKPSNIRIDTQGHPHVLDFGLAKVTLMDQADPIQTPVMTATGQFVGSLPWASPEQVEGMHDGVDVTSDVYSLGVILYQMLTGHFPYPVTGTMRAVMDNVLSVDPIRPRSLRHEIDDEVETILLKCLRKEREERYASAGALGADIERYLNGQPIAARRESAWYVFRARARQMVRKHPVTALLGVILLAAAATQFAVAPLVVHATPAHRLLERWAVQGLAGASGVDELRNVRVIALQGDDAAIRSMIAESGMKDVSSDPLYSLRRLHGRMMEKLAQTQVAAVAWDITFETDPSTQAEKSEYDADFARGVRALHARGIDVIVGAASWKLDPDGMPSVSRDILRAMARWGSMRLLTGTDRAPAQWSVDLAMRRGASDVRASLALAAFAAVQAPGYQLTFEGTPDSNIVRLSFWRPSPENPAIPVWSSRTYALPVSAVSVIPRDDPLGDLAGGDVVAEYILDMPADAALRESTIDYADALRASPKQLGEMVDRKVVLFADLRGDPRFSYSDGREIHGAYGHAVGIEQLLRGRVLRLPGSLATYGFDLSGAAVGVCVAWGAAGRNGRRYLGLLLLAAAVTAAGLAAARTMNYLCNPLIPLGGAWIACELAARVRRVRDLRR